MDENEWLADRFEEHRAHLRAVAYRMLGSLTAADDAVQDTWLRLSRNDSPDAEPHAISDEGLVRPGQGQRKLAHGLDRRHLGRAPI